MRWLVTALLALAPLAGNNVIRLLPPLIATRTHLDRSLEILRRVLQAMT